MINDKSLSQAEHSFTGTKTTTMGITSRQKFQNMQKLSTMVREIEQNSSRPAHPEQILEAIKNNIKNNYNKLYDNYEANKGAILKNIQQTEMNDANEGTMKQKFQNVLKEKNAYDRLKVEVQRKQKKLKKLLQLRDQTIAITSCKQQLKDTLQDRTQSIRQYEQHRTLLEYEWAVLESMKKQREAIKLNLKERHDLMLEEEQQKKERTKKIADATHTKKVILDQIQEKIRQEDMCEIPLPLSEQLQRKLQQYQGKHTQANILIHEKILSLQKSQRQKFIHELQQQEIRNAKLTKQKEQKRQYEIAYNHFLLKQTEEERIKRFCRVGEICEVVNGSVQEEKSNLLRNKEKIEAMIAELTTQNKKIRKQIETIITTTSQPNPQPSQTNFLQLEQQLQAEQTQLRRLKTHTHKKQSLLIEWQSILQTMFTTGGKGGRAGLLEKLRKSIPKYEGFSIREHVEMETVSGTAELKDGKQKGKANLSLKYKKLAQKAHNESSQISSEQQI